MPKFTTIRYVCDLCRRKSAEADISDGGPAVITQEGTKTDLPLGWVKLVHQDPNEERSFVTNYVCPTCVTKIAQMIADRTGKKA